MHVTLPFSVSLTVALFSFSCLFLSFSQLSSLNECPFTHPLMTSINVLGLPTSVKDILIKGKESVAPALDKKSATHVPSKMSDEITLTLFYWAQPRWTQSRICSCTHPQVYPTISLLPGINVNKSPRESPVEATTAS